MATEETHEEDLAKLQLSIVQEHVKELAGDIAMRILKFWCRDGKIVITDPGRSMFIVEMDESNTIVNSENLRHWLMLQHFIKR